MMTSSEREALRALQWAHDARLAKVPGSVRWVDDPARLADDAGWPRLALEERCGAMFASSRELASLTIALAKHAPEDGKVETGARRVVRGVGLRATS